MFLTLKYGLRFKIMGGNFFKVCYPGCESNPDRHDGNPACNLFDHLDSLNDTMILRPMLGRPINFAQSSPT